MSSKRGKLTLKLSDPEFSERRDRESWSDIIFDYLMAWAKVEFLIDSLIVEIKRADGVAVRDIKIKTSFGRRIKDLSKLLKEKSDSGLFKVDVDKLEKRCEFLHEQRSIASHSWPQFAEVSEGKKVMKVCRVVTKGSKGIYNGYYATEDDYRDWIDRANNIVEILAKMLVILRNAYPETSGLSVEELR